jgi:hypothetical protein
MASFRQIYPDARPAECQNALLMLAVTPCVITRPEELPTNVPTMVVFMTPLGLVKGLE